MSKETLSDESNRDLIVDELKPVTIAELLGGKVLPRPDIDRISNNSRYADLYERTGKVPLEIFRTRNSSSTGYIIVGPELSGLEFNGILHFAAPSKTFGYDTNDIINDWGSLYNDQNNTKRLNAHRAMSPRWEYFERKRELILSAIKNDYNRQPSQPRNPQDVLIPVARLIRDAQGNFSWNFEDLEPGIAEEISKILGSHYAGISNERMLPTLGPVFIGAYSPDITDDETKWPSYRGYSKDGGTQNMGATQILPLSLILAETLNDGILMRRLVHYLEMGEVQAAETPHNDIDPNNHFRQTLVL